MTTISFGPDSEDFVQRAFYDSNLDEVNLAVESWNSTTVVLRNRDTGLVTTLTGTGIVMTDQTEDAEIVAGTITSIVVRDGTTIVGTITDFSSSFADLGEAITNAFEGDDPSTAQALIQILNQNGTTLQGLNGNEIEFAALFGAEDDDVDPVEIAQLISYLTNPVTTSGTAMGDDIVGGNGNDTLSSGGNDGDEDFFVGSNGSDTYSLTNVSPGSYYEMTYILLAGGVTININGVSNTGTVVKTTGTDTLNNVAGAMGADGLFMTGSEFADVFNVTVGANQWISLAGLGGADQFNLTLNLTARLDYRDSTGPILANLAAGGITEGGGTSDSLTVSGTGRLEIRGSDYADTFIGSSRDESLITEEGNDTIDAGGGFDRLRFDRNHVSSTSLDL